MCVGTRHLCVRSDKRGAHNLLKPQCIECSSEVKDTTDVGVFCSRYETGPWIRPDLTIEVYQFNSLYYGSESSSLYTCNTS